MFVIVDFLGHGGPAMLWLRLSVSHPIRRRVAPAAATEAHLAVVIACPAHVGVIFPMYGYALGHITAILQHQVYPIKSWFHFAQSCEEIYTNLLLDPC